MKIVQAKMNFYTVFEDNVINFNDGINVIIGENGTGKTHLIKLLYSAGMATDAKTSFPQKLVNTMLPDGYNISRLITRRQGNGHSELMVKAKRDGQGTTVGLRATFHSKTRKWEADVVGDERWEKAFNGAKHIFIPAKEVLSNNYNLNAAVEKNNVRFDDTYLDILNASKIDVSTSKMETSQRKLLSKIKEIIGGQTKYDRQKDTFYLKKGNSQQEFTLVSEGIRKVALLWQLIKNGMLDDGGVLYWDEPEANINPSYIPLLVDILFTLQRHGLQIFVATHDYFLPKYIDAKRQTGDLVQYHSLYFDEDRKVCTESADRFENLDNNRILETVRKLYREEVGVSLSL